MEKIVTSNLKLGIIAGGQLGKMLIQEASKWDLVTYVLDNDENCPAKSIAKIVPRTAAAPPSPASEPTDFPRCKSLGIVWIFVIVNWNPASTNAIRITAKTAFCANTERITDGIIIAPPINIAVLRALSTVFP